MKKHRSLIRVRTSLLLKNLAIVYWHIGGIVLTLIALITAGGAAIALLDGKPFFETLYLAFITALTIGYGDLAPETPLARIIAILIGTVGIVYTGIIVAASLRALEMTVSEQAEEK